MSVVGQEGLTFHIFLMLNHGALDSTSRSSIGHLRLPHSPMGLSPTYRFHAGLRFPACAWASSDPCRYPELVGCQLRYLEYVGGKLLRPQMWDAACAAQVEEQREASKEYEIFIQRDVTSKQERRTRKCSLVVEMW